MAYDQTQEMFLLALSSHAGAECIGPEPQMIHCVESRIQALLGQWSLTDWQIVWGPGVALAPTRHEIPTQYPSSDYPANVMYAAYREADAALCISISATNDLSGYDVEEDFRVHELLPWPYAPPDSQPLPQISQGFYLALDLLRDMRPGKTEEEVELPGFNKTLPEWLGEFISEHPKLSLITAGQSLGGVLAPIVALWLWETQSDWNPQGAVLPEQFSCWRFAAPTPGDRAFAQYYNERLPATTNVINHRDFAPKMFDEETLREILDLYLPFAPGLRMTGVIDFFRLAVAGKGYTQPGSVSPRSFNAPVADLPRAINECLEFTNQMGYHHLLAYFHGLGLEEQITDGLVDAYHQFNNLCERPFVAAKPS